MKVSFNIISLFLLMLFALTVAGNVNAIEPTAKVDTGEGQLPPYSGPKASTAVAKFDWKAGSSYQHGEPTGKRQAAPARGRNGAVLSFPPESGTHRTPDGRPSPARRPA